ncbi:MAG: TraR/DksA C4-type zinc finger protein [Chloroflexi bacterium]|nr:TraR/DksA C4-type zinc finger protein [Chloroflexota bacterium]
MQALCHLLEASASLHHHLCPRQVLGVRLGMFAGELLDLNLPQTDKRLYTVVETDGCAADGIAVATGCWVGRRTMRVEDYGKVAATFVDTISGEAIRIAPRPGIRALVNDYAPEARGKWEAQLFGYQRLPADQLFSAHAVELKTPIEQIISRPGLKVTCDYCGEEIMNQREIERDGATLCRACAGESYFLIKQKLPRANVRELVCFGAQRTAV